MHNRVFKVFNKLKEKFLSLISVLISVSLTGCGYTIEV